MSLWFLSPLLAALCALSSLHAASDEESRTSPVGFASLDAYGQKGTSGGGDLSPIRVSNARELRIACERTDVPDKKLRDQTPRVILVENDIDLGSLENVGEASAGKPVGIIQIRPHTTLTSSNGATLRRGTLESHGSFNIIIRNLRFRDLWEFDPTGKYDRYGWDYVRLTNAGQARTHHVWVDHCDFGRAYDGQLDIVHGADCITVSFCHFHGDETGPHKKSVLIGHSSSSKRDAGYLNVTLHHNLWENVESRTPRTRFGNIHAFSNFVVQARYGTVSVLGAATLVENCIYQNTRVATAFAHAGDSKQRGRQGTLCILNSLNLNPTKASSDSDDEEGGDANTNFKSTVSRELLQFNKPAEWPWDNLNTLPYAYSPSPVEGLEQTLRKRIGPERP